MKNKIRKVSDEQIVIALPTGRKFTRRHVNIDMSDKSFSDRVAKMPYIKINSEGFLRTYNLSERDKKLLLASIRRKASVLEGRVKQKIEKQKLTREDELFNLAMSV